MKRSGLGLALALSLAACEWSQRPASQGGLLEAQWTGADSGRIFASAAAEWCADRRWLEVRAVQGDTGLALALYPVDNIVSDSYPVVEPARADSTRPSASMGLRVFSQTAVKGFRGDSGAVVMVRSGSGLVSGRLTVRGRGVPNGEEIRLSGKFEQVAVRPQQRGCEPEPLDTSPEPPPTSEDAGPVDGQVD